MILLVVSNIDWIYFCILFETRRASDFHFLVLKQPTVVLKHGVFFAYGANNILTLGLNWSQIGKRGGEFSMFASAVFCQGEMTHPQPHQPSAFALENDGDSSYGFISWVTVILGEFWEMAAYRGIKIFWDLKTAESACSGSPLSHLRQGCENWECISRGKERRGSSWWFQHDLWFMGG